MFYLSRIRRFFTARARDLFVYHDGTKWRRADPVRVAAAIERELPNYLEVLNTALRDENKAPVGPMRDQARTEKLDAAKKLTDVARVVFDLKPLGDTDGVTDVEAFRVLSAYIVFMEGLADSAEVFTGSPGAA